MTAAEGQVARPLADFAVDAVAEIYDFVALLDVKGFNKLENFIDEMEKIEKKLKPLEKPLKDIESVLGKKVIKEALKASQFVYDTVAAPVIDPILKATGIQNLIDKAGDSIKDLLPKTDFLQILEGDLTKLEALPSLSTEADVEDFLKLAELLDRVRSDYGGGYDGVPLNVTGGKTGFWETLAGEADEETALGGQILFGEGGKDKLTVTRDHMTDVVFGGNGNDTLNGSGDRSEATAFDVFSGGKGDDLMKAKGNVLVLYDNVISDYALSSDGSDDTLFVEHVNLRGNAEDDGRDEIRYDSETLISFAGLGDPIEIAVLLDGLQVVKEEDEVKDLTGFDDQRDFLIGGRQVKFSGGPGR